jgi:hypothetical protein
MWQIEIKIGKRFEVLEEGPFDTREAAVAFAEAEVSVQWQWRVTQPVRCNRCAMLAINGMNCHETGCPNLGSRWDAVEAEWVRYVKCFECGCDVREGEVCCGGAQ